MAFVRYDLLMLKRILHIGFKIAKYALIGVYVLVALLNSAVVQSYIGAAAGSYFSKEWGGKVRIGAIHFSPISHVILDNIELISPDNDTIFVGERLACRFNRFPFHDSGLHFDRVLLRNARYHLATYRDEDGKPGINLNYIINYFATDREPSPEPPKPFEVDVKELRLRNVDYIQDLPESPHYKHYDHGVVIPHMRFLGTNGVLRRVRVINDSVTVRIVAFSTTEQSGMHVEDLSADIVVSRHGIHATNLDLQTGHSRIFMDAHLVYHGWEEMSDYCNTVEHDVVLKEGTEVNICEASYWAPMLWGMDCLLRPRGHVYGTIADMQAEQMMVDFGQESRLFVDAHVTGLPMIENTRMDVDIHRLHTSYDDLAAVKHPEPIKMQAPDLVRDLSPIDLEASLHGGASNCMVEFGLNSTVGDLEGNANVRFDSTVNNYAYRGEVTSRGLVLSKLMPNDWVTRSGFHMTVEGRGLRLEDMELTMDGRLYDTWFKGKQIDRTVLSAEMKEGVMLADLQLNDSLIKLDLTASADLKDSSLTAELWLDNAQLTDLKLATSDSAIQLSTRMRADVQGLNPDQIKGTVVLRDTRLKMGERMVRMDSILLDANDVDGQRQLSLRSDWVDLALNGYYQLSDVPLLVQDFCNRYLPTYYNPYRTKVAPDLTALSDDNFDFNIEWKDNGKGMEQLVPGLRVAEGTRLWGNYNMAESMKLVMRCDSLTMNSIGLHDIGLSSSGRGENYQLTLRAGELNLGTKKLMEAVDVDIRMSERISALALKWGLMDNEVAGNAQEKKSYGDLELFLTSTEADNKIVITKPNFHMMGQQWSLVCPSGVLVNRERLKMEGLKVYGMGQSVSLSALISEGEEEFAKAEFDGFAVGSLCDLLLTNTSLDVEGRLDGMIYLHDFKDRPHFDAALTVDGLALNGHPMGDMTIHSQYLTADERLNVDLSSVLTRDGMAVHPIECHGYMLTRGTSPTLNFNLNFAELDLKAAKPLLANVSSDLDGLLSGWLQLRGTVASPQIDGTMKIDRGLLQLSATGVAYLFDDSLKIDQNRLHLNRFAIHDAIGNAAYVNGELALNESQLELDLNLNTDRIMVLNKPMDESAFYGRLIASANGTIKGPVDRLDIQIAASALEGSDIFVPISNKRQVSENEFVVFIAPNRTGRTSQRRRPTTRSNNNMNLMLNLTVTPGVKVNLPMDFDQVTASMTAVGQGDIQVSMHGNQTPNILGDYKFTSGNVSVSLLQLITQNFAIEDGSTLNFPGNIDDARFNINAVYNQRVNLATLVDNASTGNTGDTYVQVQDVITMEGTLRQPSIKFDIRLPNAEQSVVDQVFSYIDKNNERDMLNQSISLLLFGRFSPSGSSAGSDNMLTDGVSSINLLTSSASSIVSNLVKVVDVNFKYQAATAATGGKLDVGISKQWNKFYFESTFGYGNANNQHETDMPNVLVGDVELGYKLNPYVHFYGFHRTNTSYFTRTELPYKQGVGIKVSKDFNTLYDLMPWLRPSTQRRKTSATQK